MISLFFDLINICKSFVLNIKQYDAYLISGMHKIYTNSYTATGFIKSNTVDTNIGQKVYIQ